MRRFTRKRNIKLKYLLTKLKRIKWKRKYTPAVLSAGVCLSIAVLCLLVIPLGLVAIFAGGQENTEEGRGGGSIVYSGYGSAPVEEVSVWRHVEGKVETIALEDYTAGVVAGEMPSNFEEEALKAQAVAARTYGISKVIRSGSDGNPEAHPQAPLCDDIHCQVYRSESELLGLKGQEWMDDGWQKILKAAKETGGQIMYYQGALVEQPLFHSSSGGKTENSEDVFVAAVPYLRSVESPYEDESPHTEDSVSMSVSEFAKKVEGKYGSAGAVNESTVKVTSRSEGGRVDNIQVGNLSLTGRDLRDLLGLRSANFTVSFSGSEVVFSTTGYGHGVGMSQWGANGMAQNGYGYQEILKHYYSGVDIY